MSRIVNRIRWQLGGHYKTENSARTFLSLDGICWRRLPPPPATGLAIKSVYPCTPDEFRAKVTHALASEPDPPVSRELLLEASELIVSHRRSAFVMLTAAAEVGLKQYVAAVAPHAAWLVSNVQAPPIAKMLKHYLPTLPAVLTVEGKAFVPKYVHDVFDKCNMARNELVHKGELKMSANDVRLYRDVVNDLLYLLDYYAGNEWAWVLMSVEARRELVAESKTQRSGSA